MAFLFGGVFENGQDIRCRFRNHGRGARATIFLTNAPRVRHAEDAGDGQGFGDDEADALELVVGGGGFVADLDVELIHVGFGQDRADAQVNGAAAFDNRDLEVVEVVAENGGGPVVGGPDHLDLDAGIF